METKSNNEHSSILLEYASQESDKWKETPMYNVFSKKPPGHEDTPEELHCSSALNTILPNNFYHLVMEI